MSENLNAVGIRSVWDWARCLFSEVCSYMKCMQLTVNRTDHLQLMDSYRVERSTAFRLRWKIAFPFCKTTLLLRSENSSINDQRSISALFLPFISKRRLLALPNLVDQCISCTGTESKPTTREILKKPKLFQSPAFPSSARWTSNVLSWREHCITHRIRISLQLWNWKW